MRLELKYILKRSNIKNLIKDLKDIFEVEEFENNIAHYENRNIYYDTLDFKFYRDKTEGYSIRKKLRIRISKFISDSKYSRCQIEIKSRRGFESEKKIIKISNLNDFNFNEINKYLLINNNIYIHDNLFPILNVKYERESFISKIYRDIRFTIDNNIIASSFNNDIDEFQKGYFILEPQYSILELKLKTQFPLLLKNIIKRHALQQVTYSKYAKSIDIIYNRKYQM